MVSPEFLGDLCIAHTLFEMWRRRRQVVRERTPRSTALLKAPGTPKPPAPQPGFSDGEAGDRGGEMRQPLRPRTWTGHAAVRRMRLEPPRPARCGP